VLWGARPAHVRRTRGLSGCEPRGWPQRAAGASARPSGTRPWGGSPQTLSCAAPPDAPRPTAPGRPCALPHSPPPPLPLPLRLLSLPQGFRGPHLSPHPQRPGAQPQGPWQCPGRCTPGDSSTSSSSSSSSSSLLPPATPLTASASSVSDPRQRTTPLGALPSASFQCVGTSCCMLSGSLGPLALHGHWSSSQRRRSLLFEFFGAPQPRYPACSSATGGGRGCPLKGERTAGPWAEHRLPPAQAQGLPSGRRWRPLWQLPQRHLPSASSRRAGRLREARLPSLGSYLLRLPSL